MATRFESKEFPTPVLQRALASSIGNGTFADTAYHLYTHRLRNSTVGKPQLVYANSRVMRAAASYLDRQFQGKASSETLVCLETQDYGYESDSDLDDDDDTWERDADDHESRKSRELSVSQSTDPPPYQGSEQTREMAGTQTDEGVAPPHRSAESQTYNRDRVPMQELFDISREVTGSQAQYRIAVPNIAAKTWQALVHFIYTGEIYFAPLKSQGLSERAASLRKHRERNPDLPKLCSPKSMYRAASIIGMPTLKDVALLDISSKIQKSSIAREVFSRFSSSYDDILNMQLELLYGSGMLASVMPQVQQALADIALGKKPYCEKVLAKIVYKFSKTLTNAHPKKKSKASSSEAAAPGSNKPPKLDVTAQEMSSSSAGSAPVQAPSTPVSEQKRAEAGEAGLIPGWRFGALVREAASGHKN